MSRMELGLIVGVHEDLHSSFQRVAEVGVPTCQVSCVAETLIEHPDPAAIRRAAEEVGVRISAVFMVFAGQRYDRIDGPPTMGLVPPALRATRLPQAMRFSDCVKAMGVRDFVSHIGFIPDDPNDAVYTGFIETMKTLVDHCAGNGQRFLFETGQELPSTLMRTMEDIGRDNVGVNLDPANLILYGMAHPLDAVRIFGDRIWGFHAKDGDWPNRHEGLGHEKALGEGRINVPVLLPALKATGFQGPITIEREISGPEQTRDILKAKALLEPYL